MNSNNFGFGMKSSNLLFGFCLILAYGINQGQVSKVLSRPILINLGWIS